MGDPPASTAVQVSAAATAPPSASGKAGGRPPRVLGAPPPPPPERCSAPPSSPGRPSAGGRPSTGGGSGPSTESRPSNCSGGSADTTAATVATSSGGGAAAAAAFLWSSPSASTPWFAPTTYGGGEDCGDGGGAWAGSGVGGVAALTTAAGASPKGMAHPSERGGGGEEGGVAPADDTEGWWKALSPAERARGGRLSGGEELVLPGTDSTDGRDAVAGGGGGGLWGRLRRGRRRRLQKRPVAAAAEGEDPATGGAPPTGGSPPPRRPDAGGGGTAAAATTTTIPHAILATAAARPDEDAFILPDDTAISFRTYIKRIRGVAAGLVGLGVAPGQAVGVYGANSVEWRCAHLGATFASAVAVGVHPAAPADAVVAALTATAAVVLFVDADRVAGVVALAPRLPLIHTVVVWGCRVAPPHPWLLHWDGLLRRGVDAAVYGAGGRPPRSAAAEVAARLDAATPDAPAAVVFTSGTGASPRGVVLSHDNVVAVLAGFGSRLGGGGANRRGERIGVSYLPLGHVLPLMVDVYGAAMLAITLYLIDFDGGWEGDNGAGAGAPPTAAIGDLLRSVEPTYFVAPPAVLEEMHDAVVAWVESDGPGLPTAIVSAAVAAGARASAADAARAAAAAAAVAGSLSGSGSSDGDAPPPPGRSPRRRRGSITLSLANRLFLSKVRGGLGLGSCAALLVSAAPLRADTAAFFTSLHLPPLNVYGLSETAGPVAGETPDAFSLSPAATGRPLPGMEVAVREMGPGRVGEILVRGRGVALGYAAGPLPSVPRGAGGGRGSSGVWPEAGGGPRWGAGVGDPAEGGGWAGGHPWSLGAPSPRAGVGDSPDATLPPAHSSVQTLLARLTVGGTADSDGSGDGSGNSSNGHGGVAPRLPPPSSNGEPSPRPSPSPAGFAIIPLQLTPDGYFATGDLGALSLDCTLHIHDRLTAVLVLASGAKVPPAPVETALRSALPAVEHALLVTDSARTRLGVLFALKSRPDGPSRPPRLDGPAAAVSARCDTPAAAAAGDGLWAAYLDAGVAAVNEGPALPPGARIVAWAVAADGFSADRSELTPTRKVRRAVTAAHYAGVVARMFANARGGATSL